MSSGNFKDFSIFFFQSHLLNPKQTLIQWSVSTSINPRSRVHHPKKWSENESKEISNRFDSYCNLSAVQNEKNQKEDQNQCIDHSTKSKTQEIKSQGWSIPLFFCFRLRSYRLHSIAEIVADREEIWSSSLIRKETDQQNTFHQRVLIDSDVFLCLTADWKM